MGPLAELQTLIGDSAQVIAVDEGSSIVENLQRGLKAFQTIKNCLLAESDAAFLPPAAVNHFLAACRPYEAAVYYPIVRREDNDRCFPGVKRTYVKLADGEFTGGNLFLINPAALEKVMPRLEEFLLCGKAHCAWPRLQVLVLC